MRVYRMSLLFAAVTLVGCYHATIETGAKPSAVTIENRWAHSFVFGLVAPKLVETAAKCPTGVSKVETQHSFLNGLVAILTFSIYTPISIRVTCAEGGRMGTALVPDFAPSTTAAAAVPDSGATQ